MAEKAISTEGFQWKSQKVTHGWFAYTRSHQFLVQCGLILQVREFSKKDHQHVFQMHIWLAVTLNALFPENMS